MASWPALNMAVWQAVPEMLACYVFDDGRLDASQVPLLIIGIATLSHPLIFC